MVAELEFAVAQLPFCTTARQNVVLVTPVGVKLVKPAVPLMLVGEVNPASVELCQFTTVPTLPLKFKADIVPPTHIV